MDITKKAVTETSTLHIRSADDTLLYEPLPDGKDDISKPVTITLYGPGSKAYMDSQAKAQNRILDRMQRKGKTTRSAEDMQAEQLEQLIACTISFQHIDHPSLPGVTTGAELYRAVYSDPGLGFIRDQVQAHIGDWANFTASSATS